MESSGEADLLTATKELLAVNLKSSARVVRHIDAVLLRIGQATLSYTHCTDNRYDTIRITLSSFLL